MLLQGEVAGAQRSVLGTLALLSGGVRFGKLWVFFFFLFAILFLLCFNLFPPFYIA